MAEFTTTKHQAIRTLTLRAGGGKRVYLKDVGANKGLILLQSTNVSVASIKLVALYDGPKGVWTVDIKTGAAGKVSLLAKVSQKEVAKIELEVVPRLELPSASTEVGMLARVFIAENRLPGVQIVEKSEIIKSMSYMRIVLENRLKYPKLFNAEGAKTLKDIVKAPKSIEGFSGYPSIGDKQTANIDAALRFANEDDHPLQPQYATFVNCAIEVATTAGVADPSKNGLYAWRTADSASPGSNFVAFGSPLYGNQFYTVKDGVIK